MGVEAFAAFEGIVRFVKFAQIESEFCEEVNELIRGLR
jgi:hypothetical protein